MELRGAADRWPTTGGPGKPRLILLALLAGALTASFYALLATVVLGLLATAAVLLGTGRGGAAFFAFPIGLLLAFTRRSLHAAVPSRRPPVLPGIDIARFRQPILWQTIDELSRAIGQPPPDTLRVRFGGSAAAAEYRLERRGPPQTVLILPFAYLVALSRAELEAVIAHELGHLAARDTTLARWVASTSTAVRLTVARLGRLHSLLYYPFRWYANGFFALTAGFSRRSELVADRLSAKTCGPAATAAALRNTAHLAEAFDAYWALDARPDLQAGVRPGLAAGLRRFLERNQLQSSGLDMGVEAGHRGAADRFASHPTTAQRLQQLETLHDLTAPADRGLGECEPGRGTEPAATLLRDLDGLESALLLDVAGERARTLVPAGEHSPGPRPAETGAAIASEQIDAEPVPAPLAFTVALADREVSGPVARLGFWMAIAMGTPTALVLLLASPRAPTAPSGEIAIRAIGVLIACALARLVWARRHARREPPRLTVSASGITLEDRRLLREPLRMPRDAVRLIAIDGGGDARDPDVRFPVYADGAFDYHGLRSDAPAGWAWPALRGRLPLYSRARETPNALILLDRALVGPRVRREVLHGPLNGETLHGLALRVRDARGLADALATTGLLRPLTISDLSEQQPARTSK